MYDLMSLLGCLSAGVVIIVIAEVIKRHADL